MALTVDLAEHWLARPENRPWWLQEGAYSVQARYVSWPRVTPTNPHCRRLEGRWVSARVPLAVVAVSSISEP